MIVSKPNTFTVISIIFKARFPRLFKMVCGTNQLSGSELLKKSFDYIFVSRRGKVWSGERNSPLRQGGCIV